jgi:diketogulonate reductase-like aldo/keto reductase
MTNLAAAVTRLPIPDAQIPTIGLGTFRLNGASAVDSVSTALSLGYRHIDTAAMYDNETEVGAGLRASGVARDEVFITTKVWTTDIAKGDLQASAQASLSRLKLDHVDLLLIHWPNKAIPLAQSIEALCDAKRRGYARSIGVANFPVEMLGDAVRLAAAHGEKIATNQCEYHPRLSQAKVIEACRKHGVAFVSYSPLGQGHLMEEPVIARIAARHGKTAAQIVLRWHVQQGIVAIPKAGGAGHQRDNLDVFGFVLPDDDMHALSSLARHDGRIVKPGFSPEWDR